jgi:hypothetical protein
MQSESKASKRRGLAKGLRVVLTLLLWLTVLAGAGFAVGFPLAGLTGKWGFDLSVPVSIGEEALLPTFSLIPTPDQRADLADLARIEDESAEGAPRLTLVNARGELRFSSPKLLPGFIYWCHAVVGFAILFYGLLLLRQILTATVEGQPFHAENPKRLNRLGWILVLTGLVFPVSQFFFGAWAINQVEPTKVPIIASLDLQGEWIVCGLLILVLAAIWEESVRIAEDQSLTV